MNNNSKIGYVIVATFLFIWTSIAVSFVIGFSAAGGIMFAIIPIFMVMIGIISFISTIKAATKNSKPRVPQQNYYKRKNEAKFEDLVENKNHYCPLCGAKISVGTLKCPSCKSDL